MDVKQSIVAAMTLRQETINAGVRTWDGYQRILGELSGLGLAYDTIVEAESSEDEGDE